MITSILCEGNAHLSNVQQTDDPDNTPDKVAEDIQLGKSSIADNDGDMGFHTPLTVSLHYHCQHDKESSARSLSQRNGYTSMSRDDLTSASCLSQTTGVAKEVDSLLDTPKFFRLKTIVKSKPLSKCT